MKVQLVAPLAAAVAATALLLVATYRDRRFLGKKRLGIAMSGWVTAAVLGMTRMRIAGETLSSTFWTLAGVNAWILLCSLGRPALIATGLFEDEEGRSTFPQRYRRRARVTQVLLVVGLVLGAFLVVWQES